MGVGVRRTADSCYGLGRSSLSPSLLFTSPPAFGTPSVEIPLSANSHTFLSVLILPFVLCPHPNHLFIAFRSLYLLLVFLFCYSITALLSFLILFFLAIFL